jgi:uncharacterized lipoprotein
MKLPAIVVVLLSLALVVGCKTPEDDAKKCCVEKSNCAYRNTFEFVWDSAKAELKESGWCIEKEDRAKKTITTGWRTNMSPFAELGRRDRLYVTLVGDPQSGWRAEAKQQSQLNTSQEDPLNPKKAEWKDAESDGGYTNKFLQNLDTRLQPDERWRDRLTR